MSYRYLVQKRRIGGWLIVPWNVSPSQESNYNSNVPINATLISTITIIVTTVILILRYLFEVV